MGYTRLTHKYKVERNPAPMYQTCNTELTVDHIMKVCHIMKVQPTVDSLGLVSERINSGLDSLIKQQQQQQQQQSKITMKHIEWLF
jgi:hypothetical protein